MLDTARVYARRGWSVLPLHHVNNAGECSCIYGSLCPEQSRGKHPRWSKWTQRPTLSSADIQAHWDDNPRDNVGIRTGAPSGFFVIDIDPKNGGAGAWEDLVRAHGNDFPQTYTVVTGSGGLHLYLLMPSFDVTNSAKGLPSGVDVRGTGGLVVAPPSASGIGAYCILNDLPLAPAPGWLLALLQAGAGQVDTSTLPQEDLPAFADLDEDDQERLALYVATTLAAVVSEYESATQGTGDGALFRAACSALELAQSPWNLTTAADAHALLDAARGRRGVKAAAWGGGQSDPDFARIWGSARSRTAGRGRAVPPDPHAGVYFDPFPLAPADGATVITVGAQTASDQERTGSGQVQDRSAPKTRAERLRSLLYVRSALDAIPPPRPLISGVLDVATIAFLSGKFGTYKSFVALSWACSLATGRPWFGREVPEAVPVLYVAAEGLSGVSRRIRAWEGAHHEGERVPDSMLQVVGGAVRITEADDLAALDAVIAESGTKLIVLDTLHRCAPGLEENSSTDMGRVIEAVSMLRERNGVTVLACHHTGHGGQRARGSSSIEDDADTSWVIRLEHADDDDRGPDNQRTLIHRKAKDGELSADVPLSLTKAGDGAYVERAEGPTLPDPGGSGWLMPPAVAKLLDDLKAPVSMGRDRAAGMLRRKGYRLSTDTITEAIKIRKAGEHLIDAPGLVDYAVSDSDGE
jgi:hypothetical protein